MPLDLLVVSATRRADGRSFIGFDAQGRFIRLVAPTPSGILYPQEYQIQNFVEPRKWDVIRVEAPWADSRPLQPENRVVDHTAWDLLERPASLRWVRRLERSRVAQGPLFGSSGRAVRAAGLQVTESILYVEPQQAIGVCEWDDRRERYRSRLRFSVDGLDYELPLNDLHVSQALCRRPEGTYSMDRIGCRAPHGLRLLVTLGEEFHGWCYKAVSSLLPRRTATLMPDACSPTVSPANRYSADGALEHPNAFVVGA